MAITIPVYDEDQELGDISDDRSEEDIDAEDDKALEETDIVPD